MMRTCRLVDNQVVCSVNGEITDKISVDNVQIDVVDNKWISVKDPNGEICIFENIGDLVKLVKPTLYKMIVPNIITDYISIEEYIDEIVSDSFKFPLIKLLDEDFLFDESGLDEDEASDYADIGDSILSIIYSFSTFIFFNNIQSGIKYDSNTLDKFFISEDDTQCIKLDGSANIVTLPNKPVDYYESYQIDDETGKIIFNDCDIKYIIILLKLLRQVIRDLLDR